MQHSGHATQFRAERDRLIRELHASGGYSYSQLAAQIGVSYELIAKIVQERR
jgi:transposase